MKAIVFAGQGSQFKGMGKELLTSYPKLTQRASDVLGYSIQELCLEDVDNKLDQTRYTQPALYVINALSWEKWRETHRTPVAFFAGHSLGEYNALLAAEAFDFETGLKLVQKRGKFMSETGGGGMLAVLGIDVEEIRKILQKQQISELDVANYNTPTQTILSGPREKISEVESLFTSRRIRCLPLNVSAAFHSRYMQEAQKEFAFFLKQFSFSPLKTPVIANATARPYQDGEVADLLARQIAGSVLWSDSIYYLMDQGEVTF
ncbi:MAG: ACP S-malonyltransferase [Waddliaceae bacterium]